ncbi:heme peroxidase [Thozetella sp. PMI_491]|nr:heme peroxidase [Thozetella sp. PMI_491]
MGSFAYSFVLLHALAALASADTNGIDPRDVYEEMEHILVDNQGTNSDGFVNAVTPCSNYVGFANNRTIRGEQTSAQWVRMVFHDFVTADIAAGTGGLDASIGFESDRAENSGLFVNDTLQFMSPTVNAYLSMSDNIALGLIVSVATCGGDAASIPIRTGRIDAQEAGPVGVPEPTTDLETTFAQFALAGFNRSDAIEATVCGHSLGRIHYSNFPEIVDESFVTDTNLDGGEGFDTTPDVFDAAVVNEYLNGTGLMGGPLVTAPSEADRSDLRLYASDSNATLAAMTEDAIFRQKCYTIFERMINTVPSTVTLSDPVTPLTWKAVDVALDVDSAGTVSVSGMIRNLCTDVAPPESVAYITVTSAGNSSEQSTGAATGNGTSLFGSTTYWSFNSTISSPGTTSLDFQDVSYPINDNIFVLPVQSVVNRAARSVVLRAAALTSLASDAGMTGVLYVPTSVQGTITKQVQNVTVDMSAYGTAGEYTLYEGNVTLANAASVVVKVVMGDAASQTVKTSIFDGGF